MDANAGKNIDSRERNAINRAASFIAVIVALLMATAEARGEDAVRLQSRAEVGDTSIRLRDIASLTGETAEALGDVVIGQVAADAGTTVTLEHVRKVLSQQRVNWARVSLGGFDQCRVTYAAPAQPGKESIGNQRKPRGDTVVAPAAPLSANPVDEINTDAARTVRDRLVEWVEQFAGVSRDELSIQFDQRDAAFLDAAAGLDRFAFTAGSTTALGRLPVTIERIRGEQLIATERVLLHVGRRMLAVVAVKPLKRGDRVGEGDVEVREVQVDRDIGAVVAKLDDAIGMVVSGNVRSGSTLTHHDVASPQLVRRNEIISVRVISGGLMIRTTARALEDGALDDFIKVRNERSRETLIVRVVGANRAMLVADVGNAAATDAKNESKAQSRNTASAKRQRN